MQQKRKYAMLAAILLSSFMLFVACGKLPLVTLNQLDTVHGVANPFKITKYNEDSCQLEIEDQQPFPIMSKQLHGAICVTKEDYAKLKSKVKTDCENRKIDHGKN